MDDQPFAELPAALVDDILQQSESRGTKMLGVFNDLLSKRTSLRQQLESSGLIRKESELPAVQLLPTVCATDGAYAIEKLLAADLVVAVAAAVEGLTPPSELRHWQDPKHGSFVEIEPHNANTGTLLRTIMVGMELVLASKAPHDVVLLDGSFTMPAIFFNQAFSKLSEFEAGDGYTHAVASWLYEHGLEYLEAYHKILTNTRSDKNFIAFPKYSTRREVCEKLGWPTTFEDKSMLTLLLHSGELTKPLQLVEPSEPWHINIKNIRDGKSAKAVKLVEEILAKLYGLHAIYYRPRPEFPALRIEAVKETVLNDFHTGRFIRAIQYQCQTGAILEPFPNYWADRTVKALAKAMPAFRQIATQTIASNYQGDINDVYMVMHGYRSESRRK